MFDGVQERRRSARSDRIRATGKAGTSRGTPTNGTGWILRRSRGAGRSERPTEPGATECHRKSVYAEPSPCPARSARIGSSARNNAVLDEPGIGSDHLAIGICNEIDDRVQDQVGIADRGHPVTQFDLALVP